MNTMNPYEVAAWEKLGRATPKVESATEYLILPTEELVRRFIAELGGQNAIVLHDLQEILTQIVEALLNDDEFTEAELLKLPNEDRLLEVNRIEQGRLQQAVYFLGRNIREQLLAYGAYTPDMGFPYIFHRLIGCDIMLQRLG